jgi:hypothetical protein
VTNTSIWTGFSLLAYSALWFRNAKSTLAGKMVFTVLGAVAELERSLTLERVKAGLWNARAKRKTLGRPRKALDASQIARLRAQGCSWRAVAGEIGEGACDIASCGWKAFRISAKGFRNEGRERLRWSGRITALFVALTKLKLILVARFVVDSGH